jgi:hypothetical protein
VMSCAGYLMYYSVPLWKKQPVVVRNFFLVGIYVNKNYH